MTTIAQRLKAQIIAAGVPVVDVEIGNEFDRLTWKVQPASLQAAAQPIIDGYANPTPNTLIEEDAEARLMNDKRFKAVIDAVWEAIPNPVTTKQETRQRAKAIYKNGNGS